MFQTCVNTTPVPAPAPEPEIIWHGYQDGHSDGFGAGFDEGIEVGEARCQTHHQKMKDKAAAQAREEVLDALAVDEFGDLFDKLVNWIRIIDEDTDYTPWDFKDIEHAIFDYRRAVREARK